LKEIYSLLLSFPIEITFLYIIIQVIIFLAVCSVLLILIVVLIRHVDDRFKVKVSAFSEKYSALFFSYIGSETNPEEFLAQIPKTYINILLIFIQDYFQTLSGKELESLQKLINDTWIYDLLMDGLKSHSRKKKLRAIYLGGVSNNYKIKPYLKDFLSQKDPLIFYHSARSLARMNAIEFAERILAGASLHKEISQDILVSIFLEFKPEVCNYLLKRIHLEDDRFKVVIVKILRHFNYREASSEIEKILSNTKSKIVILEIIKYAGQIECLEVLNTIKSFLDCEDSDIQIEAIKAIANIAGNNAVSIISNNIFSKSQQVQIDTAETLSELKPDGIHFLRSVAKNYKEPMIAAVAQLVLSEVSLESK
jgi:hypothetical protein